MTKVEWCVKFWDGDAWDEWANTRRRHKAEAVEIAHRLNRETDHDTRQDAFGGHRFRVRRVAGTESEGQR